MYIWRTKRLAEDLKSGNIKENDFKNYYIATSVIFLLGFYISLLEPVEVIEAMVFEAIGEIVVTIIALNIIFHSNGGDNGESYLNRVVSLSLPLLIKVFAVSIPLAIVLETMRELGSSTIQISWSYSIAIVLIQIVFFWRIKSHIQYINA